jgi:DNA recombination protein RmuC
MPKEFYIICGVVILLLIVMIIALIITSYRIKESENKINALVSSNINMMKLDLLQGYSTNTLEKNVIERMHRLEENIQKKQSETELNNVKTLNENVDKIKSSISDFQEKLLLSIERKLDLIDTKVNARLDEGFQKTNKTFESIIERITRIDEAQKNIEKLSSEVVSLQDILSDKKSRGTFGEVELKQILINVYGEGSKIFKMQHTLSNSSIADCVIYTPEPVGMICVDSKFPLENYRRMVDKTLEEAKRLDAVKAFKGDIRHHIDAIASKYILKNETAENAIMFLPSEAIFAEINAYHPELVDYAYKKKVWITAPTTIMAFLTTIQLTLANIERDKNTKIIHQELEKLSLEFSRYKNRWSKLKKDIDSVSKDVSDIHITTEKITTKFERINNVELEDEENVLIE